MLLSFQVICMACCLESLRPGILPSMINAGAIMCAGLWHPEQSMANRYEKLANRL